MSSEQQKSEFRQDIISGDWILVSSKREEYSKKVFEKKNAEKKIIVEEIKKEIESCPFEDPQRSGNGEPLLIFDRNGNKTKKDLSFEDLAKENWFVQIIKNKNPALEAHYEICPKEMNIGPYLNEKAVGFHEVVITRDHRRHVALLDEQEIQILLNAYKTRYIELSDEKCIKYILIFHNNGREAGASVNHPHSQIMALPIIPPDVAKSLNGCNLYFEKYKKCPHCEALAWELKQKERIIYKNSFFAALCPYASKVNFETRIFPLKHKSKFEEITEEETFLLADIFKNVFHRIYEKLGNPSYNFFIHTAPINYVHDYHWHIEILPRLSIWGGMELGTGIEIIVVSPEKATGILT